MGSTLVILANHIITSVQKDKKSLLGREKKVIVFCHFVHL